MRARPTKRADEWGILIPNGYKKVSSLNKVGFVETKKGEIYS